MFLLNKTRQTLPVAAEMLLEEYLVTLHMPTLKYVTYRSVLVNDTKLSLHDCVSHKPEKTSADNQQVVLQGYKRPRKRAIEKPCKQFARIVAIIQCEEQVALVTELFEFTDPHLDVHQTEFYSIEPTEQVKIFVPETVRKEQVLNCDDKKLVNFYYQ